MTTYLSTEAAANLPRRSVQQQRVASKPMLRQRTEGRLDRSHNPAILDAVLAALAKHGYEATNMNDVAEQAGVGKAAIYRRWSSKAALITDALVYWRPDLLEDDAPDTGSLAGDFDVVVERAKRNDDDMITIDRVLRVALEAAHHRELAYALDDLILFKGGRVMSAILSQAADRGEISAERDWPLVADVLTAMGLLRVARRQTVDAGYLRLLIDTLVLPAVRALRKGAPTATKRRRNERRRADANPRELESE